MNRLRKPALMHALLGVAAAWGLTFGAVTPVHAVWSEYAFISSTMGVSDSRICIGEASRGEIGCPAYAPTISPTGRINASAGLTVDSVSLTTTGTTWGYLGSAATYLPNLSSNRVSTTTISTTIVQIASTTTVTTCDSGAVGALRYNSTSNALELCSGTDWQSVGSGGGVGIPTGAIAAFASATCPTGWNEYTAARGRFLRGIDNGAGNDPDGTRAPGSAQGDANLSHSHTGTAASDGGHTHGLQVYANTRSNDSGGGNGSGGVQPLGRLSTGAAWVNVAGTNSIGQMRTVTAGSHAHALTLNADGAAESRPKNIAVIFCEYTGVGGSGSGSTSSTVVATNPAGSTGQIQYNTSGSFDASAGLTWDNAASRLTTVNISATALTVNGMAITGSSSGDRITSGATSAIANPAGTIDISGSVNVSGSIKLDNLAVTCTADKVGSIAIINGRLSQCRL